LYGDVGLDFTARTVADWLKANKKGTIQVRINSPGGSVFDGMAIYNLLKTSGRRVEVEIDGLAASAASIVAMAGDDIAIAEGGFVMIHRASTFAFGNAEQIQDEIAVLSKIDEAMVEIYSRRTAQSPAAITAMMEAETWMSAGDAIGKGFANRKSSAPARAASGLSHSAWHKAPPEARANLQQPSDTATVVAEGSNNTHMNEEQLKALLEAALAPISARLASLEAPKASAAPAAPETEPTVTVAEPVETEADAEVKAMFLAAVDGAFARFAAQGKLVPGAKEHFVSACSSPASFKAVCAMYESAPAVVSSEPIKAAPPATAPRAYSAETVAWAKKSGIDLNALDAKDVK